MSDRTKRDLPKVTVSADGTKRLRVSSKSLKWAALYSNYSSEVIIKQQKIISDLKEQKKLLDERERQAAKTANKSKSSQRQFIRQSRDSVNQPKLHKPVGTYGLRILQTLFPKRIFEANFSDIIRDMRDEANEAEASGQIWKRRWIVIRDNCILTFCVILYLNNTILKKLLSGIVSKS